MTKLPVSRHSPRIRQPHGKDRRSAIGRRVKGSLAALAAASALWGVSPAQAVTIANVEVPEQQAFSGQSLVLNGAGLRQRFVFHVYVAALYRPTATSDAQVILNSREAQVLRLTLLRDINSKALTDALNEGLKANNTEADLAAMKDTIQHFETFMKTGGEGASGDQVEIRFQDGRVSVSFKGKALGEVSDPRFAAALLKVWLGPVPAQESLKEALLGRKSTAN